MKRIRESDKRDGWYEFSPADCARFLEKRDLQRPLREWHAKSIASRHAQGRYKMNGEPFIFDCDGLMLNGQHRSGFWTTFDWNSAFEPAEPITGLEYRGQNGFAETNMYWTTTHMVQPAENALNCESCHGENRRMNWEELGYPGDPIEWGGRK